MDARNFFLGMAAGAAMLIVPLFLVTGITPADVPERVVAWINAPVETTVPRIGVAGAVTRPIDGHVVGEPTPTPMPAPALQPAPGAPLAATAPAAAPPAPTPATLPTRWRLATVQTGGAGIRLETAIGVESRRDPVLPDGTPVLVSPTGTMRVNGVEWRAIRTPSGAAGWVPSSALAEVTAQPSTGAPAVLPDETLYAVPTSVATPAGTPTAVPRLHVAHTDGVGVVLRASPRMDDRTPSGLQDGASVTVLEQSNPDWVRVRTDDGREGWLPTRYLAGR